MSEILRECLTCREAVELTIQLNKLIFGSDYLEIKGSITGDDRRQKCDLVKASLFVHCLYCRDHRYTLTPAGHALKGIIREPEPEEPPY